MHFICLLFLFIFIDVCNATLTPTTASPTAPTLIPTSSTPRVLMYPYTDTGVQGNLGTVEQTTAVCSERAKSLYGLSCRETPLMATYNDSYTIRELYYVYGFPSNAQVYSGVNGVLISNNYRESVHSDTKILVSLQTAGFPPSLPNWWAGYASGEIKPWETTCVRWTSNTPGITAITGSILYTDSHWISNDYEDCTLFNQGVCLCVQGTGTPSTLSPHPPTSSPVTASPTPFPTPPTFSPTPPTFRIQRIFLYPLSGTRNGNLGNRATTTSLCAARASTYGLTCSSTPALLCYTVTDTVANMPNNYGFSSDSPVYSGVNGIQLATSWSASLAGSGTVLLNSLTTGGFPSSSRWSGCSATGTFAPNICLGWLYSGCGFGYLGLVGVLSSTTYEWIGGAGSLECCSNNVVACACISETLSPTKRPTTVVPTQSPTIKIPQRYMYRLKGGSKVSVYKNYQNITFSADKAAPTNLTFTSDTTLTAIAWVYLSYRLYNPVTNTTTTEVYTGACNPAIASPIPGTLYTIPGTYVPLCPTNIKCLSGAACTDNLSPSSLTYTGFPDLRACYCSYIVGDFPISYRPPDITAGTQITAQLFSATMSLTQPLVVPKAGFGLINCASFIDRQIECGLQVQNPAYIPACSSQPIGCYDGTLGYGFGAFWEQNPLYPYPLDVTQWTEAQYRGIVSILNGLVYFDKETGKPVSPLTSEVLTSYFWFNSTTNTTSVITTSLDFSFSSYQTNLIQGDPYIFSMIGKPPLVVNFTKNRMPTAAEIACTPLSLCPTITWASVDTPAFHLAGMEWSSIIQNSSSPISIVLETIEDIPDIVGVEVYNPFGELCGSSYSLTGYKKGSNLTAICLSTPSSGLTYTNMTLTVRLLGQESVYDLPYSTLNGLYLNVPKPDPLSLYLQTNLFTPFQNRTWPLLYSAFYDAYPPTPAVANVKGWPQRQRLNTTYTTYFPFSVTYNYTLVTYISNSTASISAWSNISASILQSNIYPYNAPLAARRSLYQTRPYNASIDHGYIEDVWRTSLSRRYCGADETQCQTFNLGACILQPNKTQRWYNGDRGADYTVYGSEGGCNCFSSFERGYFLYQQFCKVCESGYGPNTLSDLADLIQYSSLVSPLYYNHTGYFPISTSGISISTFRQKYQCRFPYGIDPVTSSLVSDNMCAAHGLMSFTTINKTFSLPSWVNFTGQPIVACKGFSVKYILTQNIENFYLYGNITSPLSLIYTSNNNHIISIISQQGTLEQGILYYNNTIQCSILKWSNGGTAYYKATKTNKPPLQIPIPWTMITLCGDIELSITCINEDLFTPWSITLQGIRYTENPFLLSFF